MSAMTRDHAQAVFIELVSGKSTTPSIATTLTELVRVFGADPSPSYVYSEHGGRNATEVAVKARNFVALRTLHELGVDLSVGAKDRPLHLAVVEADACVPLLLQLGGAGDAQARDSGHTALHAAARWGRAAWIPALIEAGIDIEARDERGCTPLLQSWMSHLAMVALLDEGANIDAADDCGDRLVHYVLYRIATEEAADLAGTYVDPGGKRETGPGLMPVQANTIATLIGRGADLETSNTEGRVPRELIEAHPMLSQLPVFRAYQARRTAQDALLEATTSGSCAGARP